MSFQTYTYEEILDSVGEVENLKVTLPPIQGNGCVFLRNYADYYPTPMSGGKTVDDVVERMAEFCHKLLNDDVLFPEKYDEAPSDDHCFTVYVDIGESNFVRVFVSDDLQKVYQNIAENKTNTRALIYNRDINSAEFMMRLVN